MGTEMSLPFWYSRAPRTDDEVYEQIAAQYHDPIFSAVLRGLYLVKVTAEPIPSWLEGAMKRKLAEALKRAKASDKRGYP
jgi:hypothetical protein